MTVLRRVVYASAARARVDQTGLDRILDASLARNRACGVTGILWTDGERFAQVLEGPADAVADTLLRILVDPRHERIERILDERADARAFADWSMARMSPWSAVDEVDAAVERALADAPPSVRSSFEAAMRPVRAIGTVGS